MIIAAFPAPKLTPEEIREIVRLYVTENLTFSQLAKRVGRTTSSVKGIVCRNRHLVQALIAETRLTMSVAKAVPYVPEVPETDIVRRVFRDDGGVERYVSLPRVRWLERPEP